MMELFGWYHVSNSGSNFNYDHVNNYYVSFFLEVIIIVVQQDETHFWQFLNLELDRFKMIFVFKVVE